MTFHQLASALENPQLAPGIKLLGERIWQAGTDWPQSGGPNLIDFLRLLEQDLKGEVNRKNVLQYQMVLSADALANAWKLESLASLLEAFEFDSTKSLGELLNILQVELSEGAQED